MERNETADEHPDIHVVLPESIELIDLRGADSQADMPTRPPQFRTRKRWFLGLFGVTCVTTFLAGTGLGPVLLIPDVFTAVVKEIGLSALLIKGISYAGPLMVILVAHEMGHYLQSRRYGVPATLPFFIPMPIGPLGTMGAVIIQGAGYADRKALFDIAITGPLAGLVLALPVTYWGLQDAQIASVSPSGGSMIFGDPLILQWMIEYVHRPLGPGEEVILNPILFAGWVGIFITALNLIPIGQLDGGHILYTLIGRRAHNVALSILICAAGYMIYTQDASYSLIIILLVWMGFRHPPTANDAAHLGIGRKILGFLTLSFVIIGFTPTPLTFSDPPKPKQRPVQKAPAATAARFEKVSTRSSSRSFSTVSHVRSLTSGLSRPGGNGQRFVVGSRGVASVPVFDVAQCQLIQLLAGFRRVAAVDAGLAE